MALTYFRSSDGAVYAELGPAWRGFNELLSDAITPLPPRGAGEASLSTYWIDRVIRKCEDGNEGPVQSGNTTTLLLRGSNAIAASGDELFDDESMPVDEFLAILHKWRAKVISVRESERPQISQVYRRAPYPAD
ncbi:MAG TPA: hypothetical protein PLU83_09975 [Phycicoccus sp.]|nr:hypothetical protein [Phycicoccus sp.]HRA45677.1 hypothetical protein [Phycicoccus sp.]